LAKLGFANSYTKEDIEKRITELKKTYCEYDIEYKPEEPKIKEEET